MLREQPDIVGRLWSKARLLRRELASHGFDVEEGEMPIVPLVIGDAQAAVDLCEAALAAGVFAQAIRPPTVPAGTSRLRLVATAAHSSEDLRGAAGALAAAASRLKATRVGVSD
jgi:glycine C-acetyltransferase/8-amino-7-oxononanoate synthase